MISVDLYKYHEFQYLFYEHFAIGFSVTIHERRSAKRDTAQEMETNLIFNYLIF